MKIKLNKLSIENFKGIRDLKIDFSNQTNIRADNGKGKTTIFDAYSWVLWGKDSLGRKDFDIKPFNNDGKSKNIESSVEALLEIDGKELNIKKVYREVWTKKRGQTQESFTGNTTDYYINDVPVKMSEFNSRIEMLVSEKEFNLLANPIYFNSILDKKERREILFSLVEDVNTQDVVSRDERLKALDLDNYTIDELKAMAKATNKKINDKIKSIPARIDELENSKNTFNFESIEINKSILQEKLEDIEKSLEKGIGFTELISKKNQEIQQYLDRQRELKRSTDELNDRKKREIFRDYEDRKNKFESEKRTIINEIRMCEETCKIEFSNKDRIIEQIKMLNESVEALRNDYISTSNHVFDSSDSSLDCPTCGRLYDEHKQEEIKEAFNLNRSKELTSIENEAKRLKIKISELEKNKEKIENELKDTLSKLENAKVFFSKLGEFSEERPQFVEELVPHEYVELQDKIDKIKAELNSIDNEDNTKLLADKQRIRLELESINKKLGLKDENSRIQARIEKLKAEEKELAKQYEKQQHILYLCDEYLRIFSEFISDKINNMFKYVNFKLFDTQINGALVETCEVMNEKGVPYSVLSNAEKINAGLDVINTLSKHLKIQVPIFVDNAESVNELTPVTSQIIRLIVTTDENLIVERI